MTRPLDPWEDHEEHPETHEPMRRSGCSGEAAAREADRAYADGERMDRDAPTPCAGPDPNWLATEEGKRAMERTREWIAGLDAAALRRKGGV